MSTISNLHQIISHYITKYYKNKISKDKKLLGAKPVSYTHLNPKKTLKHSY